MTDNKQILELAEEIKPLQVEIRRHIHQNPELAFREFQTTKYIKGILKNNGIKINPLKMRTGVCAVINPKCKKAVAIRSDIDALPITEKTDVPFKSRNAGVMHACGHDVHMATVLGTAIILNKLRSQINAGVKFLFQPAEEQPPGGAKEMIENGVLKNPAVKVIFGLHVDPNVSVGRIGLRDGPTMSSVMDFDIEIIGRGGHAARPHAAIDAVAVAAEVIDSLQKVVSRELNPLKPGLITIGVIEGGTVRNVIAEKVILKGTARTLHGDTQKWLPKLIRRTIDGVCKARGAKFKLDILSGYPVMVNHQNANSILRDSWIELFGKSTRYKIEVTPMTLGGEDFAYFVSKIPGSMFRLGVKNKKIGADKSWHASDFMVDEEAMFYGTALLCSAVIRSCENL